MRKGRKKRKHALSQQSSEGTLNFRLCHVCLHLNESHKEIPNCTHCHAEFHLDDLDFGPNYWEQDDDGKAPVRRPVEDEDEMEPTSEHELVNVVNGLTVRW